MDPLSARVATPDALEALIGQPSERTRHKVRTELTDADLRWLAAFPFCVLATSDADGRCDASPKGDPAGSLVHVIDRRTVAIAERPGNRRVDGYHNILANPHVGMIFLVPGRSDTLRVNGRAQLVSDAPWFDRLTVRASRPVLAAVVQVEEVFGHCAKSLVRSGIWHPDGWAPQAVDGLGSSRASRSLDEFIRETESEQVAGYSSGLY
ncbi:MSMEG_1061 family FMN-dependent PPOX-type flavoprotein [Allobranchiibius sp. GilTou73]|uniref:MSMEG_1061 family FMN-dependent PPOX-type flavoprotein n=1 Tax=Allobranchiibius sp. GilTou73 TaxID=2904523 RepID=UPI001F42FD65|nr:MSMEG_1061 family FMN-dependent PPOX-type flavoprotein [Allobranchiibius sp. GilTou73]UIJ35810.1 pyridoxamine 5'-phosphate oxidase family protein [Allobranchiibius sp. GilTou73]